jgi:hypothetical protein
MTTPSIEDRLTTIEGYLAELGAFLNSSGPVSGIAKAGLTQAGTAIGDPSVVAQVMAITDWIAKSAGTTVTPDPVVLAKLSAPAAAVATKPVAAPPSKSLWGVGPGAQPATSAKSSLSTVLAGLGL